MALFKSTDFQATGFVTMINNFKNEKSLIIAMESVNLFNISINYLDGDIIKY